jgi:hypothetical protein
MPPGEHLIRQVEQVLPDAGPAVLAINHRVKVSTQVRPTKLATAEPTGDGGTRCTLSSGRT